MGDPISRPDRFDIPALTGVRGVAALAVVTYHCWNAATITSGARLSFAGQWAVDLFFVLSGFVLSLTYLGRPVDWRRFAVARVARIYPLHVLTALAMAGLIYAETRVAGSPRPPSLTIRQLIRELGLLTAMPLIGRHMIWNGPSWSISVEAWTYVLLFPLAAAVDRFDRKILLVPVVLAGLIALTVAAYRLPSGTIMTRDWIALARAMAGFAGGWAAYVVWRSPRHPMNGIATDLLALAIATLVVGLPLSWHLEPWVTIPLFPWLVLGLATGRSGVASALSTRPMIYLGNISYSIYLVHWPIMEVVHLVPLPPAWSHSFVVWAIAVIPITLLISDVTYRMVETRSRRYLRARFGSSEPPEPMAVAAGHYHGSRPRSPRRSRSPHR